MPQLLTSNCFNAGMKVQGGLGNLYANYTNGRHTWSNNASLQLAVQKLADIDWQKSLDVLRVNSQYGYKTKNEKWSIAGLLTFESLTMLSDDHAEAIRAMVDKRRPDFTGY